MPGEDVSFLDQPQLLPLIFYPRRDLPSELEQATDHFVEVEPGVQIRCRFHRVGPDYPSLLYFHGNGETVGDYDLISFMYRRRGINLWVADYRGYGLSDGQPTMSHLMADAFPIFRKFREVVQGEGYRESLFVMGRSLGSACAIALARHRHHQLRGLIVESGFADIFRLLAGLGLVLGDPSWQEKGRFNLTNIRQVPLPPLILHAEYDQLIPLAEGKELYENAPHRDKRLVIIPGADHNDILFRGMELYFQAIEELIRAHG